MNKGKLIIVSGPSGAGKSSVMKPLLEKYPDLYFSVSATTRAPRKGEVNGVHYHFVSEEAFKQMIAENALLEYNYYSAHYYGTPKPPIEDTLARGSSALLDIDVNGAAQVVSRMPEVVTVFLTPPSFEELEHRLRKRDTNTEEDIARRINQAHVEVPLAYKYQYVVINDVLDDAVRDLESIVLGLDSAENLRYENNHDAVIFKEAN